MIENHAGPSAAAARPAAALRAGFWSLAVAAALFGTNVTLSRALADLHYDPTAVAALRIPFNVAFFVLWTRLRRLGWRWPTLVEHLALALLGAVGVGLMLRMMYLAAALTSVATSEALLYTSPAWALLLGAVFLGERLSLHRWLSIPLAFAGVLLIVTGGRLGQLQWSPTGILAGMASGLCLGLYAVLVRGFLVRRGYSEIATLFWAFLYAVPVGFVLTPRAVFLPWQLTPRAWAFFLGLVAASSIGYLLLVRGLAQVEAALASVVGSLEPVFAIFTAFVWLAEPVGWVQLGGTALVLGAACLAGWERARPDASRPARAVRRRRPLPAET